MQLNLNNDQATTLTAALDSYYHDLRDEVSNTDDYELRQELKRQEAALAAIREQLEPGWAASNGVQLSTNMVQPGGEQF